MRTARIVTERESMRQGFPVLSFVIAAMSALALAGCAHTSREREFNPALCEADLAYQAGFNDGRDGNNMNAGFTYGCRDDLRAPAIGKYRDGFEKGHAEYQKEQADQRKLMARMERDRLKAEATARAQAAPAAPPFAGGWGGTRWFCSLQPFTDRFEGAGNSQVEARGQARDACEAKLGRNSIHCGEPACQSETSTGDPYAWTCKLDVFTDHFESSGPSRLDAAGAALAQCRAKRGDFTCRDETPDCARQR